MDPPATFRLHGHGPRAHSLDEQDLSSPLQNFQGGSFDSFKMALLKVQMVEKPKSQLRALALGTWWPLPARPRNRHPTPPAPLHGTAQPPLPVPAPAPA